MAGPRDDDKLKGDKSKHSGRVVDLSAYRIKKTADRLRSGKPVVLVQHQ